MLKIKLISLLLLSLLIITIRPSYATFTRDKGNGLYDQPWVIDGLQNYIYENPAYLSKVKDEAFFERIGILSDAQSMGGIFYSPATNLNIGVHIGYPVNSIVWDSTDREGLFHKDTYEVKSSNKSLVSPYSGDYQAMFIPTASSAKVVDISDPDGNGDATSSSDYRKSLEQRNITALVSYNFSKFILGLNLGYATSWADKKNSIDSNSSHDQYIFRNSEYALGLGGIYTISSTLNLDAAVNVNMYMLDNKYDATEPSMTNKMTYKSKGAMDVGGNVRLNAIISNRQTVHFRVSYSYLNRSTEGTMKYLVLPANDTDATDTFSRTGQLINFGISDEMKLTNELSAFAGFNVAYKTFKNDYSGKDNLAPANNVDKYSNSISSIQVPLILGMEGKLSTNWTARFGITSIIYQPLSSSGSNVTSQGTQKVEPTYNENSSSLTSLSIGLSYKIGNFSIDWLGNVDMFVVGPYFISGKATTSNDPHPMAMAFALTYYMDFGSDEKTPLPADSY